MSDDNKVVQIYAEPTIEATLHGELMAVLLDERFDAVQLVTSLGVLRLVELDLLRVYGEVE